MRLENEMSDMRKDMETLKDKILQYEIGTFDKQD